MGIVRADSIQKNHREPPIENLLSLDYGKLLLEDTGYILTSPSRWDGKDWLVAGLGASAVVGTAAFIDKSLQDEIQRHRHNTTDDIARIFNPFGREVSFGLLGAFELEGVVFKDDKARAVAQDGLAASLIAGGIITPSLKLAFGRSRPEQNEGAHHFDPFSRNESFPSYHATQAFTVASVVSEHYDSLWVNITSYGVASMVGYARMERGSHFASDVLVGALIGTVVGKTVVHFNREKRFELSVVADHDIVGVEVTHMF